MHLKLCSLSDKLDPDFAILSIYGERDHAFDCRLDWNGLERIGPRMVKRSSITTSSASKGNNEM